jgi:hypothetical protein
MENSDENLDLESMFRDLIQKSLKNIEEERDLSLERYRRQDETIISPDDFLLQGKFAVDYLKVAAERSNQMVNLAKVLKDIVYKESGGEGSGMSSGGLNDAYKKEIFKYLQTGKGNNKKED